MKNTFVLKAGLFINKELNTLEDIGEMANNQQEKNMIMKVAQAEKENYHQLKQLMNKSM